MIGTKDHSSTERESTGENEEDLEVLPRSESTIELKAITPHLDGSLRLHTTGSQDKLRISMLNMISTSKRRLLLLILLLIATNQGTNGFQQWPNLFAIIMA